MPGAAAADGRPFAERLTSNHIDAGVVTRVVTAGGRVVATRASLTSLGSTRTFGSVEERSRHLVSFGEATLTGASGRHTWVAGAALSFDRYRARDLSRFDYTHTIPGVFVQDDYAPVETVTLSGSARLDVHSEYGVFVSPRLSALVRPADRWSIRVSGGRGYFAPSPSPRKPRPSASRRSRRWGISRRSGPRASRRT